MPKATNRKPGTRSAAIEQAFRATSLPLNSVLEYMRPTVGVAFLERGGDQKCSRSTPFGTSDSLAHTGTYPVFRS